jgi:hypothetical protein
MIIYLTTPTCFSVSAILRDTIKYEKILMIITYSANRNRNK